MTRICMVESCDKSHKARGYCSKHLSQMNRRGEITERNRLSGNEFYFFESHVEISLCDTFGNEKARAVIDPRDYELANKYKWYLSSSRYAISRVSKSEQIFLHRLIVNTSPELSVDHIDGNTLNNRRENLRPCTHQENLKNTKVRTDNTSGYKGVSYNRRRNRWYSRIFVNGTEKFLGSFLSKQEAIEVRRAAEEKYFGEFRRKNKSQEAL